MGKVIPEREMKRRRLIVKIDHYIYSAVAAGLLTADEVPYFKEKSSKRSYVTFPAEQ